MTFHIKQLTLMAVKSNKSCLTVIFILSFVSWKHKTISYCKTIQRREIKLHINVLNNLVVSIAFLLHLDFFSRNKSQNSPFNGR